jgi:diguanylate cyclase (GGDEF)-like protein/PAS domain S-box-containing protein
VSDEERYLRLMAWASPDVVFVAGRTSLLWISPNVSTLVGRTSEDILAPGSSPIWAPDDVETAMGLRRVAAEGGTASARLRALHSDGRLLWIDMVVRSFVDAELGSTAVGTIRDVTDMARLELEARRETEAAREVLATALDPWVVLSPVRDAAGAVVDFEFASANARAVADLVGAGDLIGRRLLDVLPYETHNGMLDAYTRSLETGVPYIADDLRYDRPGLEVTSWYDMRVVQLSGGLSITWRDVTERHEATVVVAESESRYRLLAENASDVVMHARGRTVRFVSPALVGALGWQPDEWVGRSFFDFAHADELDRFPEMQERLEQGESIVRRLRARAKDGSYHWVETHTRPYAELDGELGTVTSFRVVDAEVMAEVALRDSETRYRMLAENASDVVYQVTPDGVIRWISPAVVDALGWRPDQLVGTPAVDLLHPDDVPPESRDDYVAYVTQAVLGAHEAVRYRASDGEHRYMSVRARALHDATGAVVGGIVGLRDVTTERVATDELAYRAFHDQLTGLHNRAWVLDMLDADLRATDRRSTRLGVLFIDLDNFKVVNDSLGHVAGDGVLATVAQRIVSVLRPDDRVGRFGGDEFVVVVPDITDTYELEAIAQRLSDAISVELTVERHRIVPTASIGIAVSTPMSTSESLLRDTDSALFRAKAAGRSRWHFFDEEMHAQAVARLTIEDELRQALERHEFVVHYQPIVELVSGRIVGHEALVRWIHPDRGMVPPNDFLPVAEESGLIVDIGHEVLHAVCRTLVEHPELPGPISVNKSPLQIQRPGWLAVFSDIVASHGVDPSRLIIEITETAVLTGVDVVRENLQQVRDLGIGVHVDDFGTGYSSISLLRDLPITGLKLDSTFTWQLTVGETPANALAAGLAGLAQGLELMGIAEGVETEDQRWILVDQGWTHGQGWLFGRPQAAPALTSLVEQAASHP